MQIILRKDAKALGLSRYFTGKPCKKGHISERYVSEGKCVECRLIRARIRRDDIRSGKAKRRAYYKANKEKINRKLSERLKNDPQFKLGVTIRYMIRRVLRLTGGDKDQRSLEMVGYTPDQLVSHLESQFKDGMSWENHGEWHIDHIVPVTTYLELGVTDPSVINALENLQPLWAKENISKGNRYVG